MMLALRYLNAAPVVTGSIRRSAADFRVAEIPLELPVESGEHVYLLIEKVEANTHWVAREIASFCGLQEVDVSYAGRKDRHAITRQWFSCYLPKGDPDWDALSIEGVTVLKVARHERKLRRGELKGNRFTLWIRDLAPSYRMGEVDDALSSVQVNGFPNYFGEQRFGRDGRNLVLADAFLKRGRGTIRGRDMLISAARSCLFNHYLSKCIDEGEIPDNGPLYGRSRDPQPGEDDMPEAYAGWIEGLQRLKVKAGTRPMLVRPQEMSWRFDRHDICLSFTLPAGSFATSLLREVVNYAEDQQRTES
ncbi:MAG: tRNA pseudouridine(13) synthase TruD [Proteobacteria bacterium]|jgi:tRNA pseudouridine13 synthase|nr:tRNA pseudouridine(13) synthase TruD [Pseudomonadota bacterium]